MIYLISQIAVSLCLAALLGGALGWLLHRSRGAKRIETMRQIMIRQSNQLSQAQTDVVMLTDDFDDLKQRSQTEIERLKQDNRQIPALNQNLEKSQLLVRQLMQKHEARVREINHENQTLATRLATLTDREDAYNKLQAELDMERRKLRALALQAESIQSGDKQTHDDASSEDELAASTETESGKKTNLPAGNNADSKTGETDNDTAAASKEATTSADMAPPDAGQPESDQHDLALEDLEDDQFEISVDADNTDPLGVDLAAATELAEAEAAIEDNFGTEPAKIPAETPAENPAQHPADVDDSSEQNPLEPANALFEPVEQRDDLKQIFGIGPVTEKALNKLGITSYSQLADLKRHEIESIASALQIFPGRIERDNWVGNARRQLEEVLEEL